MDIDKTGPAAVTPAFAKVPMTVVPSGKRSLIITGAHWANAPRPAKVLLKVGLGYNLRFAEGVAIDFALGKIVDGPNKDRRDALDAQRAEVARTQGIALVRSSRPDSGIRVFEAGDKGISRIDIKGMITGFIARGYALVRGQVVRHVTDRGTQFKLELVFEQGDAPSIEKVEAIIAFLAKGVNNLHVWDNTNNADPTWTINGTIARPEDREKPFEGQIIVHAKAMVLMVLTHVESPQFQQLQQG